MAERTSSKLHTEDLRLARACAQQDARALAQLERGFLASLPATLSQQGFSISVAEEAISVLRERLLVPARDGTAKIAEYSGRGSLAQWLRVCATRIAIDIVRAQKPHVELDLDAAEQVAPILDGDPELRFLKERYQPVFRASLRAAFAKLSAKERNLLRYAHIHGLSFEQIGALHKVRQSTISRWMAAARKRLTTETRRQLRERLRCTRAEMDSLIRIVDTRLDWSLRSFLGST